MNPHVPRNTDAIAQAAQTTLSTRTWLTQRTLHQTAKGASQAEFIKAFVLLKQDAAMFEHASQSLRCCIGLVRCAGI